MPGIDYEYCNNGNDDNDNGGANSFITNHHFTIIYRLVYFHLGYADRPAVR